MPSYQYRITGETQWMSSSGSGIFAITNKVGSAKKITVTGIEIYNQTRLNRCQAVDGNLHLPSYFDILYCTALGGGEELTPSGHDTAASWGSTLKCYKKCGYEINTGRQAATSPGARFGFLKQLSLTSPALQNVTNIGKAKFALGTVWTKQAHSATQAHTVREGEKFAIVPSSMSVNIPLLIEITLTVSGSPARTFSLSYFTNAIAEGTAVFGLDNPTGSGVTVTIEDISFSEMGTADTAYFQIVPISQVDGTAYFDDNRKIGVVKTDTAAPDFTSTQGQVFFNVPVYPAQGIPWEYVAAGSVAGVPKGYNYFHSKDFNGPVFGAYLLEAASMKEAGASAAPISPHFTPHLSMKRSGLGKAPIVLREGEGIALVSGGERADTGLGMSGWQSFEFGITIKVENAYSPYLTVSGFESGSDVTVLRSDTKAVVAEQFDISGTTYSWGYDTDVVQTVDVCVYKAGKVPWTIRNLTLGAQATSVPVQQVTDRNYTS